VPDSDLDREFIDPLARAGAIAIAGGRIALGLGAFGLTHRALGALGFARPRAATVALARLAGGRDVALGLHALTASGDRARLREAALLGAAVDAGDAVAFGAAIGDPAMRRTALLNAPLAAGAAVAGLWVASRL
jgi:hypothetical protein